VNRRQVLEDWQEDPWDDPAELYEFEAERRRDWRYNPLKYVAYIALATILVLTLVAGAAGFWLAQQLNPSGRAEQAVNFTVNQGDSLDSISRRLEAEGIITDARVFRWYASWKGGVELTPGYYAIRPRDTMGNVLGILETPPAQTFTRVTFPEGFTVEQIGRRLARDAPRLTEADWQEAVTSGEVTSRWAPPGTNLEGLLFPDTYQISGDESAVNVAKRMARLMDQIGERQGLDKAPQNLGISPYDVLTVASMIEREAKFDEERPLIARVIYNRLFFGTPLQIDATLFYGLPDGTSFVEARARQDGYNTYENAGLPPTPIANPGEASIRAALNPAANPDREECPGEQECAWLYYVLADAEGRHAFATNLADHERNVEKARALGLLN
jgi:UPF0755 protein